MYWSFHAISLKDVQENSFLARMRQVAKVCNAPDFLCYDNDTLPGNSGSPVIGRGTRDGSCYAVKGIHVAGTEYDRNKAQGLQSLANWLRPEEFESVHCSGSSG